MRLDWHSRVSNSTLESIAATHLVSLLIYIWSFFSLGLPRNLALPQLITLIAVASLFIVYGAVLVIFSRNLAGFRYHRLFDSIYVMLLLVMIIILVHCTGDADSPVRVMLLIPVIMIATIWSKNRGVAAAVAIGAYLAIASLLDPRGPADPLTQSNGLYMNTIRLDILHINALYVGVMVLAAWLVGGFSDMEKETLLNLADVNRDLERVTSDRTRDLALASQELEVKIAECRRAESQLKESEDRFRSIFVNASVGVALIDKNTCFLIINDAFCSFLGLPPQEILYKRMSQFMPLGDGALKKALNDSLVGDQNCMLEQRFVHKNGEIVWGRLNASLVRNVQDAYQRWVIVCEDVTSLKTKESELQAQSRIYEAMHIALQEIFEPSGQMESDKPNLLDLAVSLQSSGYEKAVASRVIEVAREITGATWVKYFSYDPDGQTLNLTSSAGMPSELFEQSETQFQLIRGTAAVRDAGIAAAADVAAGGDDTSINVADAIRDAAADEKRSLVSLTAGHRKSLYVPNVSSHNPGWMKLEPGIHSCYLVPIHYGETLFGVLALVSKRVNGFSQQQRAMADTLALYISTALENTRLFKEVQQAFERINNIQQQLLQSQKMEAVGQLAGGIAHDLNNQLTVIQASVDLNMEALLAENNSLSKAFTRIRIATEKSANLIRQLLLFGRKHPQFKVLVDLNVNVAELQEMLERLIGEDVAICHDLAPDLWAVRADATNIEQVVINLAINARDAMPDGGIIVIKTENVLVDQAVAPHLRSSSRRFICLSVSDTGTGIEKQQLPHIFEPFFTTKEAGKGTGLGLSVAYGIVEAHGGWIDVESVPGAGSKFKIYLPAQVLPDEADVLEHDQISLAHLQGKGERILLVEDDPDVAAMTMSLLEENGYTVQSRRTVDEARKAFQQSGAGWDLLLSDVILPDGQGISLFHQLRLQQPSLEAIMFSGYADERACLSRILEEGILFLPKPFNAVDLLRKVREAMDRRVRQ